MIDYLYNPKFWEWGWELRLISQKTGLLTLVVALLIPNFKVKVYRRILAFTVFSLLMEHVSTDEDLSHLFIDTSNAPWYHLLTPILFLLMTRFFTDYLMDGQFKWWLPLAFSIICIFNAIDEEWGDGFYNFPSLPVGIYSLTGMTLVVNYFIYTLRSLEFEYLEREPMFWVSSGWLIYMAGSFLLWVSIRFMAYDNDFFFSIYRVNMVVTMLLNGAFIIALVLINDKHKIEEEVVPEI